MKTIAPNLLVSTTVIFPITEKAELSVFCFGKYQADITIYYKYRNHTTSFFYATPEIIERCTKLINDRLPEIMKHIFSELKTMNREPI